MINIILNILGGMKILLQNLQKKLKQIALYIYHAIREVIKVINVQEKQNLIKRLVL